MWFKPLGGNLLQVFEFPLLFSLVKPLLQFLNHVIDVPVFKGAPCRLCEELGNLGHFSAMGQEGTSLEKELNFVF